MDTYDPSGNELGAQDAAIAPHSRGLPDQLQGRFAHLVLKNEAVKPDLFSMRHIKANDALDAQFEEYRRLNPSVERDLLARVLKQQASGVTRGNFKQVWTTYRSEKFGPKNSLASPRIGAKI